MPLIAIISSPTLSLEAWQAVAARQPEFVRSPPREWFNPFNRKRELLVPPPTDVEIVIDGDALGLLGPSSWFEEDHELLVFARQDAESRLVACVQRTAQLLGATLEWIGPDHPERDRCQ